MTRNSPTIDEQNFPTRHCHNSNHYDSRPNQYTHIVKQHKLEKVEYRASMESMIPIPEPGNSFFRP
ncbi:hypothetical protein [Teredinibacter haidensis]|uniref:hypothetical protein n=1 Tax=Teredinibacter haidensis TaxID=2731755 RepID=UPI000B2CCD20|nr:hypothetical protein [Teredinibacter haidensis]